MRITQTMLSERVEVLAKNGRLAPAYPLLAKVGYSPGVLDKGLALLEHWRREHLLANELAAIKKRAVWAKTEARKAARREMTSLANTIRVVFTDEEFVWERFGIGPRYRPGRQHKQRIRPSESLDAYLDRWNSLLEGVSQLQKEDRALLVDAGWLPSRIEEARKLIEISSDLDWHAFQKKAESQKQTRIATALEKQVREWYSRASRLVRIAIRELPREQRGLMTAFLHVETARAPGEK